jgi:hypothetical protein
MNKNKAYTYFLSASYMMFLGYVSASMAHQAPSGECHVGPCPSAPEVFWGLMMIATIITTIGLFVAAIMEINN